MGSSRRGAGGAASGGRSARTATRRRVAVKQQQAAPLEEESANEEESSEEVGNDDRLSVVRTTVPSNAGPPRDFGVGDLKTSDSVAYLGRKKSSAAATFKAATRKQRSERQRRHWKGAADRIKAFRESDGAMWVKFGIPLFVLGAMEAVRLVSAASGDAKGADASPGLSGSILIGICLSVAASCLNALGLNLQRLGQNEATDGNVVAPKNLPVGLNTIGVAMTALSGVTDLISFGFAPQSLLAPFGAMTLIVNLALAPILHNERFALVDVAATIMVCVGIAIALMSSPSVSPSYTLRDLQNLAARPVVPVYLGAYVMTMGAVANHIYQGETSGRGDTKAVGAGYPVLSGMLGGLTTLNAKIMTELFKIVSLKTHPQLLVPVIGMMAVCAVTQAAVLNRGLGRHSSLFVVPLFSASILLANLSGGGVIFNEFAAFEPVQLAKFLVGVAIVVSGVTTLATREEEDGKKKEK